MATPTLFSGDRERLWNLILKSMGYRSEAEFKQNILVCAGVPDTEPVAFTGHDYNFVWDSTNNNAYFHSTGTTYAACSALTDDGGSLANRNATPNS